MTIKALRASGSYIQADVVIGVSKSSDSKPKAERCRVCKKKVRIQINRGTGLCSQVCAKTEKKEK